jgi:AcrR family transcriptional regulator
MDRRQLIWERMAEGPASRKLDYGSIVRAAMKLADRDGIEAVSMRNVAAALDAGTMSLYRYVAGKDDLLDLILDAAYGEIRLPQDVGIDWQNQFRRVAVESRRVMKSHPWLASLMSRRPTLGPNYLRWFECLLGATLSSGRNMQIRIRMIGTAWSYVSGFIAYELGEMETNRKYKLTEAKKRKAAQPYVAQILATGRHPHLSEFLKHGNIGQPTDEDFTAGLNAMLTGIASM